MKLLQRGEKKIISLWNPCDKFFLSCCCVLSLHYLHTITLLFPKKSRLSNKTLVLVVLPNFYIMFELRSHFWEYEHKNKKREHKPLQLFLCLCFLFFPTHLRSWGFRSTTIFSFSILGSFIHFKKKKIKKATETTVYTDEIMNCLEVAY